MAQRGSRGIALLFNLRANVQQRHDPGRFTTGKDPVPTAQEVRWAPETVWTGVENLAFTGVLSPDRPSRSESLYRLSYCVPLN
jgi:hypothetical protein